MYLTILALPLFSAVARGLLGRKLGVTGAHIIRCSSLIISAVLGIIAFYEIGLRGRPVSFNITSWIERESLQINWAFMFDSLTVSC